MSDKTAKADKADSTGKGKGGKLKLIGAALGALTLLGGGGAAVGYWVAGSGAAAHGDPSPDVPQLVPRTTDDGETPPPPASERAEAGADRPTDRSRYTATYYAIETPFTSNLKESDAFVQLSLGVATYYDSRVVDAVRTHEPAIRSAVLMRLSEHDAEALTTAAGRTALQRDLTRAINAALRERTGFGGIDNVYFTSFVVQ